MPIPKLTPEFILLAICGYALASVIRYAPPTSLEQLLNTWMAIAHGGIAGAIGVVIVFLLIHALTNRA